jgi:probable rRNA maturation factor
MTPEPPSIRSGPQRAGRPGTLEVFVADEQSDIDIPIDRYAALARYVLETEGVRGDIEFALMFIGQQAMTDLNRTYMHGDGPTDVLAFPIDDDMGATGRAPDAGSRRPAQRDPLHSAGPRLLGDVVVCPTTALAQAAENAGSYPGHEGTLLDEIDLLVVHGILHVLGHDHAEPDETEVMQAAERRHLAAFAELVGVANPPGDES